MASIHIAYPAHVHTNRISAGRITSYKIVVKLQCIPHIDNEDSDINLSFFA